MKINVTVDCTPDEARRFLGLPDVAPMQQQVIDAMQKRLVDAITETDTATLVDRWMPMTLKGIEEWQSMWSQLTRTAMGGMAGGGAGPAQSSTKDKG